MWCIQPKPPTASLVSWLLLSPAFSFLALHLCIVSPLLEPPRTSSNLLEPPRTSSNLLEPPRTSSNLLFLCFLLFLVKPRLVLHLLVMQLGDVEMYESESWNYLDLSCVKGAKQIGELSQLTLRRHWTSESVSLDMHCTYHKNEMPIPPLSYPTAARSFCPINFSARDGVSSDSLGLQFFCLSSGWRSSGDNFFLTSKETCRKSN